jgi:phage-related protein
LSSRSEESLDAIGYGMARSISGSPTALVESIFSGMGPGALQGLASGLSVGKNGLGVNPRALGQLLFSQLTQLPAGQQAIQQAITGQGLTLLKKFGTDKLTEIGGKLLGKLTQPIQDKLTKGITKLIGNGLGKKVLSEFGSGILSKFGGIGGTLSSLMSGELNLSSLLKTGLSLIPGVGTIYSAVSAIPIVGPFINKVIDGVIGFAKKIPILGHILKGAEKVIGWVGKGLKTVWDGVKKVGKAIWGGVKKVGEAIWGGVKKVGSAIVSGIKKVGSAIAKGIKKFFSGW